MRKKQTKSEELKKDIINKLQTEEDTIQITLPKFSENPTLPINIIDQFSYNPDSNVVVLVCKLHIRDGEEIDVDLLLKGQFAEQIANYYKYAKAEAKWNRTI